MKSLSKNLAIRFLFAILSLIFISLVTFLADEIAPGDQATVAAGEKASVETVNRLREQMGLNRPWPVRYGEYVSNALKGTSVEARLEAKSRLQTLSSERCPSLASLLSARLS